MIGINTLKCPIDKKQIHPMISELETNRKALELEEIEVLLADAGYGSEANFTKDSESNIEILVAIQKEYKQKKSESKCISEDLPPTKQMEEELHSARCKELYKNNRANIWANKSSAGI